MGCRYFLQFRRKQPFSGRALGEAGKIHEIDRCIRCLLRVIHLREPGDTLIAHLHHGQVGFGLAVGVAGHLGFGSGERVEGGGLDKGEDDLIQTSFRLGVDTSENRPKTGLFQEGVGVLEILEILFRESHFRPSRVGLIIPPAFVRSNASGHPH
jgi:hypothetical protein